MFIVCIKLFLSHYFRHFFLGMEWNDIKHLFFLPHEIRNSSEEVNHDNWCGVYEVFNCSRVNLFSFSHFIISFFVWIPSSFLRIMIFCLPFFMTMRDFIGAFRNLTLILSNPFHPGPFSKASIASRRIKMISMKAVLRRTTKEMKSETKIKERKRPWNCHSTKRFLWHEAWFWLRIFFHEYIFLRQKQWEVKDLFWNQHLQ